jgi:hypothetical protein
MSDTESDADRESSWRPPSPQPAPEDGPMSLRVHRPDELKYFTLAQMNDLAQEKWEEEDYMAFVRLVVAGRYVGEHGREFSVVVDPRRSLQPLVDHPELQITRDIDSALGYTASLPYHNASRGLKIYPVPLFSRTLTKGVHLKVALPLHADGQVSRRLIPTAAANVAKPSLFLRLSRRLTGSAIYCSEQDTKPCHRLHTPQPHTSHCFPQHGAAKCSRGLLIPSDPSCAGGETVRRSSPQRFYP